MNPPGRFARRHAMPYLNCPSCELTIYSAASYSTRDECPRCATPLRSVRRPPRLEPQTRAAQEPAPARTTPSPSAQLDVNVYEAAFGTHVEASGELIYPNASRLDAVMEQVHPPTRRLVLDLRAITDIDSSGLASMMALYVRSRQEDFEFLVV